MNSGDNPSTKAGLFAVFAVLYVVIMGTFIILAIMIHGTFEATQRLERMQPCSQAERK